MAVEWEQKTRMEPGGTVVNVMKEPVFVKMFSDFQIAKLISMSEREA